jgi:hypothetical protein
LSFTTWIGFAPIISAPVVSVRRPMIVSPLLSTVYQNGRGGLSGLLGVSPFAKGSTAVSCGLDGARSTVVSILYCDTAAWAVWVIGGGPRRVTTRATTTQQTSCRLRTL